MSLSSTSTIKAQLATALGPKASAYFETLSQFVSGRISRSEFEDTIRQSVDSPNLVQLHNALIISLFDASSHHRPLTPPPDAPKPPPRKRRRILPYQGPDAIEATLRSPRLKRWTLAMGKRERERLRNIQFGPPAVDAQSLRRVTDEITRERGIILLPERGEPPGTRVPPVQLASVTLAPTLQHISDRLNLISAQHNLGVPSRAVASLMMLAFEAKLKQLITHALTLTSTSHAISSINPSEPHSRNNVLTASAFDTLFTIAPAALPNKSATAMRLALGENDVFDDEDVILLKDREVRDQRWQMFALLAERSTLKEALRTLR